MGDLYCEQPGCEYVAEDNPAEYATGPAARLSRHKSKVHGPAATRTEAPVTPQSEPAPTSEGPGPYGGEASPTSSEIPPAAAGEGSAGVTPPRAGGLLSRLRRKPKGITPEVVSPGREKRPKAPRGYPRGGRQSVAELFGMGWSGGGTLMQRAGHIPTGRMLTFQAPVAGELLDDLAKGTMLDKVVLQKLVGTKGKLEALYAVLGPPVITWQLEKAMTEGNGPKVDYLESMLMSAVKDALPIMLPAMKKARKREEETNKAFAELLDGDELAALGVHIQDGAPVDTAGAPVDVGQVFVHMLFTEWTPPVAPPAPQPTEESATP